MADKIQLSIVVEVTHGIKSVVGQCDRALERPIAISQVQRASRNNVELSVSVEVSQAQRRTLDDWVSLFTTDRAGNLQRFCTRPSLERTISISEQHCHAIGHNV